MKIDSFFRIVAYSFFSTKFYVWVLNKAKGYGITYFLLLNLLCLVPLSLNSYYKFSQIRLDPNYQSNANHKNLNYIINLIIDKMPDLHIKNGIASMPIAEPYIIEEPDTNMPLAIFDTSGKVSHLKDQHAILLVTNKIIMVKINNKQIAQGYIAQIFGKDNINLNKASLENFLSVFAKPINWLFLAFFSNIIALIINMFLGFDLILAYLVVFIVSSLLKIKLPFQTILRLIFVASGPALIVNSLSHSFFNYNLPSIITSLAIYVYSINVLVNYKDYPDTTITT